MVSGPHGQPGRWSLVRPSAVLMASDTAHVRVPIHPHSIMERTVLIQITLKNSKLVMETVLAVLPVSLFVCLSVLSVCLSVCLSVSQSVCLSVFLFVCYSFFDMTYFGMVFTVPQWKTFFLNRPQLVYGSNEKNPISR